MYAAPDRCRHPRLEDVVAFGWPEHQAYSRHSGCGEKSSIHHERGPSQSEAGTQSSTWASDLMIAQFEVRKPRQARQWLHPREGRKEIARRSVSTDSTFVATLAMCQAKPSDVRKGTSSHMFESSFFAPHVVEHDSYIHLSCRFLRKSD